MEYREVLLDEGAHLGIRETIGILADHPANVILSEIPHVLRRQFLHVGAGQRAGILFNKLLLFGLCHVAHVLLDHLFDIGVTHAAGVLRGNSLDVLLREVLRVLGNELLLLFRTQLVDVVLHHGTDLVLGKYVLEGTHYCLLQQIPHILEQSRLRFAACIPRIGDRGECVFHGRAIQPLRNRRSLSRAHGCSHGQQAGQVVAGAEHGAGLFVKPFAGQDVAAGVAQLCLYDRGIRSLLHEILCECRCVDNACGGHGVVLQAENCRHGELGAVIQPGTHVVFVGGTVNIDSIGTGVQRSRCKAAELLADGVTVVESAGLLGNFFAIFCLAHDLVHLADVHEAQRVEHVVRDFIVLINDQRYFVVLLRPLAGEKFVLLVQQSLGRGHLLPVGLQGIASEHAGSHGVGVDFGGRGTKAAIVGRR